MSQYFFYPIFFIVLRCPSHGRLVVWGFYDAQVLDNYIFNLHKCTYLINESDCSNYNLLINFCIEYINREESHNNLFSLAWASWSTFPYVYTITTHVLIYYTCKLLYQWRSYLLCRLCKAQGPRRSGAPRRSWAPRRPWVQGAPGGYMAPAVRGPGSQCAVRSGGPWQRAESFLLSETEF